MELLNTYLRSIKLLRDKIDCFNQYPICLPVFRELDTFFVHTNSESAT